MKVKAWKCIEAEGHLYERSVDIDMENATYSV